MTHNQYTEELQNALRLASMLAKENRHATYSPAHLMRGLLYNEIGLAAFFTTLKEEVDVHYLRDWADIRIELYPKSSYVPEEPTPDFKAQSVMEVADMMAIKLSEDLISPISVFIALCRPDVGFSADQLKSFPLTEKQLLEGLMQVVQANPTAKEDKGGATPIGKKPESSSYLGKYCIDKTAIAREGKLDPIVGRDKEIRMVVEVLCRRSKPNVILTGEPGVGKTALVDGLAQNIILGKVPHILENALLLELDMGALAAGASYKGEVEERMKNIIAEMKQHDKVILFIDEIHALLDGKSASGGGTVSLLKPELARGEITLIGATTNDEFRKIMETEDKAFLRRFEIIRLEEPDEKTAIRMIQNVAPHYERHHNIKADDATVPEAVRLAKRYLKDRYLPDSAIDLIDRTMSAVRLMSETSESEIHDFQEAMQGLVQNEASDLADYKWLYFQLKNRLSPILLAQFLDEQDPEKMETIREIQAYLENMLTTLLEVIKIRKENIDASDIAAVVAHKTGIPIGKIQTQEKEKLLTIESILKKRVVGQDHAIKIISDAILESRSGLNRPGQPIGSFFLLGPTGTGKTELAKSLAEYLFNHESALIRFDMSEFKEEHSAALLYGAPPGYVGYQEGGLLVSKIRQHPYAVVLFDEIEKAHTSVFDVFLQILDEGILHDRLGREGDFSNAIILFTSNIGSEYVVKKFGEGEIPASTQLLEIMGKYFRPEFLGRLTEIAPFAPINEETVELIFDIQVKQLIQSLRKQQDINLEISPEARKQLALEGFTPQYGARPIRGVIRNRLRRPISKMLISGELPSSSTLKITLNEENEEKWDIIPNNKQEPNPAQDNLTESEKPTIVEEENAILQENTNSDTKV